VAREGEDLFGKLVGAGRQRVAAALLEGLEELLGRVFPPFVGSSSQLPRFSFRSLVRSASSRSSRLSP
jgi:hypothetical protein